VVVGKTVNPLVASSNLASGVFNHQALTAKVVGAFCFLKGVFPQFFHIFPQQIVTNNNTSKSALDWV